MAAALAAAALAAAGARAAARKTAVLFLGDSLTLGLGVEEPQTFPALVDARWRREKKPWRARSFGMLGGDSGDIRDYLDLNLERGDVGLVFLMIGGNDGFEKVPPEKVERHVAEIIERVQARGVPLVLAAMGVKPEGDRDYAARFDAVFPTLARRYKVPLMPFPLAGIVGRKDLTIDGVHPNAAGHRLVAERVYGFLRDRGLPKP